MRKQKRWGLFAGAVLAFACMMTMTVFGKEERTPVGKIHLNFSSDIQAGEAGGTVDEAWRTESVPLTVWISSMKAITG